VEFEDKAVAKSVAGMLNNQPMGGKHRSAYRFDLWCLKYLPKFKVGPGWAVAARSEGSWSVGAFGCRQCGCCSSELTVVAPRSKTSLAFQPSNVNPTTNVNASTVGPSDGGDQL